MNYALLLTTEAEKGIGRLDKRIQKRVRDRLRELVVNPCDHRISKPVKMATGGERVSRVGDWRILYEVDEPARKVIILALRHRSDAYQKL